MDAAEAALGAVGIEGKDIGHAGVPSLVPERVLQICVADRSFTRLWRWCRTVPARLPTA
jgi:hypothetical protein